MVSVSEDKDKGTVADPGFPIGGRRPRLRFKIFLCQNERIWTPGGRVEGCLVGIYEYPS